MVGKDKRYSIPVGVCRFRYDGELKLEYADEGLFTLIKMTPEDFAAKYDSCYDRLLLPVVWENLQARIESSLESGEMLQIEYAVQREGAEEWHLLQAVILEKGKAPLLQGVITDITEVKKTFLQLEQEKQKLNVIAEMSGDMLFEYDIEKDIMDYTRQREGLLNDVRISKDYAKVIKKTGYVHPDDAEALKQFCEELQMGKKHIYVELRKKYRDGRYHWIEIEGTTLYDYEGKPLKVIGRTKNIDERKNKEEQLRLGMEKDSLTGLLNHQTVVNKINTRLQRMNPETANWLIIIDVDNFKQINDMNGHLVGDAVLCMVADEMKNSFQGSLLGRIGGDEFIAYVENMSQEKLEDVLVTLNSTMQDLYKDSDKNMKVSCSVGVAACNGRNREYDNLFQWADYALYKVKQESKNGYYIVQAKGNAPEIGYLIREEKEEYVREEATIRSADELVMFTLELLDNVTDIPSGLKMVSDRICSFFDIDDIAYVSHENGRQEIKYNWSRKEKRQTPSYMLPESKEAWQYIWSHFDSKGMLALRKDQIRNMPGEQVESILFVYQSRGGDDRGCIVFVDRQTDRDWEGDKEPLSRLASILFNKLQQLYENERTRSEIDFQLNYDSLTGLLLYHRFIALSEQHMREYSKNNYYFVYSDFANFQYMNELYGYTEGDKILQAFAEQLKSLKNGVFFTRVTSDYFVGLLEGEDEEQVRQGYLEATQEFCARINQKYDQSNLVLVSGFSKVLNRKESPSSAIDRANVARKYGKDTANTVVIAYSQEIKARSDAEKAISANMTWALENGEFKAWLQPKISVKTGKIVGAEALVRWQRADGTMIFPDSFIPIFEKNGFIKKIDFAILEQVLCYLRDAMDKGEQVVPVSVNFSRRHNETADFVDKILHRLKEQDIPAAYLEAEITESIFMLDLSTLTSNLHKLKESGIAISIDDFGSGYSSLNVLANVEADVIKLDKKFLEYTSRDSKAPVFVKYLVKMMKRLGYKVIAEGVETKEQLELLRNAECDMVQGYYYARPMPILQFREFLKEFNKKA